MLLSAQPLQKKALVLGFNAMPAPMATVLKFPLATRGGMTGWLLPHLLPPQHLTEWSPSSAQV